MFMNEEQDKILFVKEKLEILICQYPFWETLNPKLHLLIKELPDFYQKSTNVKAKMTHYSVINKDFMKIAKWVHQKIPKILSQGIITTSSFKLVNIWGALYNENEYTVSHKHRPSTYSFVYFVNVPKNSSPLVFDYSNTKIYPHPGKCAIFPSWISHKVPKNKSKERSVISGNFAYMPENDVISF